MSEIRQIEPKWKTMDGREFSSEKDAQKHQAVLGAQEVYRDAVRMLGKVLAESMTTADGCAFDWSNWNYYYITPGYWSLPGISVVKFYVWNVDFEERDGTLVIVDHEGKDGPRRYAINDLYADRTAANRALVTRREAWLAEKTAEVAADRALLCPESA